MHDPRTVVSVARRTNVQRPGPVVSVCNHPRIRVRVPDGDQRDQQYGQQRHPPPGTCDLHSSPFTLVLVERTLLF